MKVAIRKMLRKWPIAYNTAIRCHMRYKIMFAKENQLLRMHLATIKNMSKLVTYLKLHKLEFIGNKIIIQIKDGLKYCLNLDIKYPLSSIPLYGSYEERETNLLLNIIKPGWNIIDVGANFGWYTTHFSRAVGKNGTVHSFEPIPAAFSELSENVTLNKCSNVILINSALGKTNGIISLYTPEDLGTICTSQYHYGKKSVCKLITIDDYVREAKIKKIHLIKADVEGGEFNVLIGAEKTLNRDHPDLFLEVQEYHTEKFGYLPKDLFTFLTNKGYIIYHLNKLNRLEKLNDFNTLHSLNFYCSVSGR